MLQSVSLVLEYVGNDGKKQSSMTAITGEDNVALVANFTFVARDSQTQKAAPVNYLVPEREEEKHLYALGEARAAEKKKQRMQQQQHSSYITAATSEQLRNLLTEAC